MSDPDILVVGASGKAGREVCRALDARDIGYFRGTRRPASASDRRLDLRDRDTWPSALRDVRRIFLLRPPDIADIANTLGPFVSQARSTGTMHFVFLSVAGAHRNRLLPHAKVERCLASGPCDWTILRPDFFAQNLEDAYLGDIRDDDRIYVPSGKARIAFVDLHDVGDVAAKCLVAPGDHTGKSYHLTGPAAFGFADVAAALTRTTGRRIAYEPASVLGYVRHLRRTGIPRGPAAIQTCLHVALRSGRSARVSGALRFLLGRPGNSVIDYIDRSVRIWQR